MRLAFESSNYLAEILQGGSITEHFWYYVVRRKASNEIIDMMKFKSNEEATQAARELLCKMDQAATLSFLLPV